MSAWTGRLARWWNTIPPSFVDVGLASLVAAVVDIAIHVANEPGERSPDLVAYLIGASVGAVLLARRQQPLAVLLVSGALLLIYYTAGYPGLAPTLPLAVALYTAAASGYLRWSLLVAGFFMTAGVIVGLARLRDPLLPLLTGAIQDLALLGAVIMLGVTVRSRRIRLAEARDRLAEVQRQRDLESARRVAEERLRIARDVHDIVGHSIAAVTLQAGLARDLFDERPAEARDALDVVVRTVRNAMSDLKVTVGVLRSGKSGADDWMPTPGLSDVDELVELAGQLGVPATLSRSGARRPLPGVVELCAYRIVQESLTNVVKHADATSVAVAIHYGTAELTIEVTDDGHGPKPGSDGSVGYGMVGMTERAAALGGRLEVGPGHAGGFRVCARIPVEAM
ncbi:MAG: histidine kinase [Labedaea sp.]